MCCKTIFFTCAARDAYFDVFRSCTRCERSSSETVSLRITMIFWVHEERTMSGRRDVTAVSMGNCNASLQRYKRNSQSDACSTICCVERDQWQDLCEAWVPERPAGRNFLNVLPCIVCLTASCVASALQKTSRRCRMIARTLLWSQVYLPCMSAMSCNVQDQE